MESKVYIKVSVFQFLVSSPTEPFISGKSYIIGRGYDAGKRFIWGSTEEQKKSSFFARFLFAQIVTSSSETLAYPLDTIRRRLMMESGKEAS